MIASFFLLSLAMRALPLGVLALGEAATPLRLLAAALILAGIVLMKISAPPG